MHLAGSEGPTLLKKLRTAGFSGLVYDEPRLLRDYLEDQAALTGDASLKFLSEAVHWFHLLHQDNSQGVPVDVIGSLDEAAVRYLRGQIRNAQDARRFRDEIEKLVSPYL